MIAFVSFLLRCLPLLCVLFGANALVPSTAWGYDDAQARPSIAYDKASLPVFDYDSASILSANENQNLVWETGGIFGKCAKFLAAKSGTVVIGENMARVAGDASRIGAETFQGTGMEANRLWIQEARSAGKQVIDIDPDFARRAQRVEQGIRPDSIFYNMERMETTGYEKLSQGF